MYNRLLVAVDGTELSNKVLDHAVAIAEKFGSELKILTVIPDLHKISLYGNSVYDEILLFEDEKYTLFYNNILIKAEEKVRSENPNLKVSTIILEGRPSTKIVDLAEKEVYDMIIMGKSSKKWIILEFLEESTSNNVIDFSNIPIMIIT